VDSSPCGGGREIKASGEVTKGSGYKYTDELTGQSMVEYHVDDCKEFMEIMNKETEFGGKLSVRFDPEKRPLVVFGQDECIVKQYLSTPKSWTGADGEKPLTPKDDGHGVMISAFVSREFGFGTLDLMPEQLQQINSKRQGQKYKDEAAAKKKRGSELKQPLTKSPFVLEFEYGAAFDGYWTYNSMVLQVKDCADVLNSLYPDEFEFLFLFDHLCGHD
jgi:hypothetical protein